MSVLRKSRIIKVEIEISLPADATHDQIEEWLDLELGCGGCDTDNPLSRYSIEAIQSPLLSDTGFHLHERAEPGEKTGTWITHRWREGAPFEGPPAIDVILGAARPASGDGNGGRGA